MNCTFRKVTELLMELETALW